MAIYAPNGQLQTDTTMRLATAAIDSLNRELRSAMVEAASWVFLQDQMRPWTGNCSPTSFRKADRYLGATGAETGHLVRVRGSGDR